MSLDGRGREGRGGEGRGGVGRGGEGKGEGRGWDGRGGEGRGGEGREGGREGGRDGGEGGGRKRRDECYTYSNGPHYLNSSYVTYYVIKCPCFNLLPAIMILELWQGWKGQ